MRGFGVEAADSEIYEQNRDGLIRFAAVLVGPDEAEGVLSTAVTRILRRRPLSEHQDPRASLYRAVLDESRSMVRRRGTTPSTPDPLTEWGERTIPLEVWEAVRSLPVRQRAAAYLFYWIELTVGETAALMSIRPATVKRYLRLARLRLKEALDG